MVAWEIKGVGGVIPRTDARLIPDNMAVEAVNCDLTGGLLVGLPNSVYLADLGGRLPVVERAYRVGLPIEHPPVQNAAPTVSANPVISGTGIVGQPLYCDTGRWNNVPTSWTGTWYRDGVTVIGHDFVYYVVAADRGRNISCGVVASNAAGSSAQAMSNTIAIALPQFSTPPVNTRAPIISGTASQNFNLNCDLGQWINSPTTFICQWFRDNQIVVSTGTVYQVQFDDVGHNLSCLVTASNQYGSTTANPSNVVHIDQPNQGGGGDPEIHPPPPGNPPSNWNAPQVSGNPTPYFTLTTTYGIWNDTPESFTVQWFRDGIALTGQTYLTYTVDNADIGHSLSTSVTAYNPFGIGTSMPSNSVYIPIPVTPPFPTQAPFISGIKLPNYRLDCGYGSWLYTPTSYVMDWYKNSALVKSNSTFYDLTDADKDYYFYTIVTATNSFGSVTCQSNTVHCEIPGVEIPSTPPINTVAPWIYGDGQAGGLLHCDLGQWGHLPANYLTQWIMDGSVVLQSRYEDYTVGSYYQTDWYQIGHSITCKVIAGNSFGQTEANPSNTIHVYGYGRSLDPMPPLPVVRDPEPRVGVAPLAVGPTQQDTVWLPLPSRFSSVVRSPLANDKYKRIYWTNPNDYAPHYTTTDRLRSGIYTYLDLGIVQPTFACSISNVTGGTPPPDALPIDRSYTYTYINEFEEESGPAPTSNVRAGAPDGTWTITFPGGVPSPPVGVNYAALRKGRLYRTIVSASAGAQFYFVHEFTLPFPGTYDDVLSDADVSLNEIMETTGWNNPPPYLDGLCIMPGGFMCGFTGNTVHFSEPNRPHTWPDIYDQSVHYDIITLAVWQQYLVVLTNGYPSAGSGNMPSNILFVQTQVPEPCISRGSVIVDLSGVFYASLNGLIQYTGYNIQNVTVALVEKDEWLGKYRAKKLFACRHRTQFLGVNESNYGFLIDYAEQRLAFQDLSYLRGIICIWNDEFTGDTLMCDGSGKIYQWDVPGQPVQTYRWKSKQFFTPMPISLGAAQVELDRQVLAQQPPDNFPLDNQDSSVTLPAGVNAQFRYYAGPTLQLIMTRNLTQQMEIFRLPNGFKCFDHQIEVTSRVPISSIQVATTLGELKTA